MLRIFREQSELFSQRASEHAAGGYHSISRKLAARASSRKRGEIARIDFRLDLLERFLVLAARREVLFNFFVPGQFIASCYVRRQFCKLLRRQPIDSLFDFRKTHGKTGAAAGFVSKTVEIRTTRAGWMQISI